MKEILLTQGKIALVDNCDYDRIIKFKWHAAKREERWYAYTRINRNYTALHRFIMGASGKEKVDHKDFDGLNNLRENLRICSNAENSRNHSRKRIAKGMTSKFTGVSWDSSHNKWFSKITVDYKQIYLGIFSKEIDAAKAYDSAAQIYFKEFARLNLP